MNQKTIIIAHRGASGEAPENTMAAFQLAEEQGAEGMELDIHLSADGEIIVCHDPTVDRTTNGTGRIEDLTVPELRKLDAGSWFHSKFQAEKLPLLEEVFSVLKPETFLNIEVKCPYSELLEKRLMELVVQYDRLEQVVVSSFEHKTLVKLKKRTPELRIGLLYSANFQSHSLMAASSGVEVYSLHPHYEWLGAEDIEEAIRQGLRVYPYTINRETDGISLFQAKVSGVITDYPAKIKAVRDSFY
ncbi:glycerophosphodiester phosphodiesterase [Paenibacillus sinopodophylli]|uniref:glycerophosphodiester phosphodiesterase n=1 Tax=Paenibacillus sinopodophylli TaxID=1837342 RepID=UPI00110C8EF0|nr:glycerophosphodiester phosphodiesterase [Paenibacillus sinopodophylli]